MTKPAGGLHPVRLIDFATLVVLAIIWGSSFLFIELGLRSMTPISLAACRIAMGAAILYVAARALGHRFPRDPRRWGYFFLMGFLGHVIPFSLINTGQMSIDSGLAAILIATVPLITLPLAHFFTDDRFDLQKACGIVLGFGGVIVLIGPDALGGFGSRFWGQMMIVGAATCFAVTLVLARRIRDVHPLVASAASLGCSTVMIVILAFVVEAPLSLRPGSASILGIVLLGVFSTGAAMLIYFHLTSTVGPNFVAANNYIAPGVGVMWGVVLLGEPFTWRMVGAFAIVLAGIAVATIRLPRRRAPVAAGE